MKTTTFETVQRGRGFEIATRETIHADGRVEWSETGHDECGTVSRFGVRRVGHAVDLHSVATARIASGWREVA